MKKWGFRYAWQVRVLSDRFLLIKVLIDSVSHLHNIFNGYRFNITGQGCQRHSQRGKKILRLTYFQVRLLLEESELKNSKSVLTQVYIVYSPSTTNLNQHFQHCWWLFRKKARKWEKVKANSFVPLSFQTSFLFSPPLGKALSLAQLTLLRRK